MAARRELKTTGLLPRWLLASILAAGANLWASGGKRMNDDSVMPLHDKMIAELRKRLKRRKAKVRPDQEP